MATRWTPAAPAFFFLVFLAISFVIPAAAWAGGVAILPGKWEFTTTTQVMAGQPRTDTATECVTEESFDPQRLVQNTQQCSITKSSVNGSKLDATMRCDTPMGPALGDMSFQSDDDEVSGDMTVTMNLNGQKMKIETSWKGRRLGDCD